MKSRLCGTLLVMGSLLASHWVHARTGFPGMLVEVNTEEGQTRLARAEVRSDFEALVYNFELQPNRHLGAVASATIILNALRAQNAERLVRAAKFDPKHRAPILPLGVDPQQRRYTQLTFFTAETDKIKTLPEVLGATRTAHVGARRDPGFKLKQYVKALRAHGLNVRLRVANETLSDKQIRTDLITNLSRRGDYVIINYDRIALGQRGHAHYSPLGAYDKKSDSFLIMDVNSKIAPWVWVKSSDLIFAMRTHDAADQKGYVLVSDELPLPILSSNR